eukprot:403352043
MSDVGGRKTLEPRLKRQKIEKSDDLPGDSGLQEQTDLNVTQTESLDQKELQQQSKTGVDQLKPQEHLSLQNLPTADMYERSFMHKEPLCFVIESQKYEYIFTMSVDGYLKFWKKVQGGIEFVKTFRAHLGKITGCSLSSNESRLATVSGKDQTIKIFDVVNFDLMHMVKVKFIPDVCEFIHKKSSFSAIIAVAEFNQPKIHIIKAESADGQVLKILKDIHFSPIRCMKFCSELDLVISTDESGVIEYWDPETFEFPQDNRKVTFELVSDTGLLELVKNKTCALSMALSNDGQKVVLYCKDRKIRLFRIGDGKLLKTFDESLQKYVDDQLSIKSKNDMLYLDKSDFERRLATEKEIEKQWDYKMRDISNVLSANPSIQFDESDTFLIFGSLMGIKIVNIRNKELVRIVGKVENTERFIQIGSFQGKPSRLAANQGVQISGYGGKTSQEKGIDPTFICSAFKKNRFYLFTQREPDEVEDAPQQTQTIGGAPKLVQITQGRDVFNEKIGNELDNSNATNQYRSSQNLPDKVILYTSFGEIHCTLYPNYCPKTVENFTELAKRGYYNNVIFHRVIKSFMVQTGDPSGDGTGGESIWGEEFEDEFCEELNHNESFMLSMANCGPGTNSSQFFITTAPTPWLNGKHTVFGRVTRGMEVAQEIENVRVDDKHKPLMDIKIQSIKVYEPGSAQEQNKKQM